MNHINQPIDYEERGFEHYLAKRWEEAIADLTIALESNPTDVILMWRAECYRMVGDYEAAIRDLTQCIPFNDATYGVRAELFEVIGDFDSAISDYTTYIEILSQNQERSEQENGSLSRQYLMRGHLYNKKQNWEAAILDFTTGLSLRDINVLAWHWHERARAYLGVGRLGEALTDIQIFLERFPGNAAGEALHAEIKQAIEKAQKT